MGEHRLPRIKMGEHRTTQNKDGGSTGLPRIKIPRIKMREHRTTQIKVEGT